jgi:vanillate O-demethylase monooxygenase subunit
MQRKFLDEGIVLYRTEHGDPIALSNRCAHRFAPVHKG